MAKTVSAIAAAGASYVSPIVLHLRPGAREWWQAWLARERPDLLPRYAELYRGGSYVPKEYQDQVSTTVRDLAARLGIGRAARRGLTGHERAQHRSGASPHPAADQLSLL